MQQLSYDSAESYGMLNALVYRIKLLKMDSYFRKVSYQNNFLKSILGFKFGIGELIFFRLPGTRWLDTLCVLVKYKRNTNTKKRDYE